MASSGSDASVAVIGSGFAGLLTAIHLLAADPGLTVRLVEKAPQFGRGRAYGARSADHVLNVRVANMSAFPDRLAHFSDWLAAQGLPNVDEAFVSRGVYGDYLQDLLRAAVADAGGRLLLEQDEAVAVEREDGRSRVRLALGRSFETDAVVLAVGLGPPRLPEGADPDVLSSRAYVGDPWRADLDGLPSGEILLLGAGLSMVDAALSLARDDRDLLAISRHGLLPQPHGPAPPAPPPAGSLASPLEALRALRGHAREVGGRRAVDSVRPMTTDVWRSWSLAERRRFLRHVQPWWDSVRHRVSPQVAQTLARAMGSERLAVLAGRLESLTPVEEGFRAEIRLRGRPRAVTRHFRAVVNCTGLSAALGTSPLLAQLRRRGDIRPDALDLGIEVDDAGRAIAEAGGPSAGLYVVGPLTRASRWESIAVPDLRNHAAEVAAAVVNGLRVGSACLPSRSPTAPSPPSQR